MSEEGDGFKVFIDLSGPDADVAPSPLQNAHSRRRRRASIPAAPASDDSDLEIVEAPAQKKQQQSETEQPAGASTAAAAADLGEDEDLAIVSVAGQVVLRDLPHERPDCAEHRFSRGTPDVLNARCCAQCYCYVCDVKASECTSWGQGTSEQDHCHACKSDYWSHQRSLSRANRKRQQEAAGGSAAATAVTAATARRQPLADAAVAGPSGVSGAARSAAPAPAAAAAAAAAAQPPRRERRAGSSSGDEEMRQQTAALLARRRAAAGAGAGLGQLLQEQVEQQRALHALLERVASGRGASSSSAAAAGGGASPALPGPSMAAGSSLLAAASSSPGCPAAVAIAALFAVQPAGHAAGPALGALPSSGGGGLLSTWQAPSAFEAEGLGAVMANVIMPVDGDWARAAGPLPCNSDELAKLSGYIGAMLAAARGETLPAHVIAGLGQLPATASAHAVANLLRQRPGPCLDSVNRLVNLGMVAREAADWGAAAAATQLCKTCSSSEDTHMWLPPDLLGSGPVPAWNPARVQLCYGLLTAFMDAGGFLDAVLELHAALDHWRDLCQPVNTAAVVDALWRACHYPDPAPPLPQRRRCLDCATAISNDEPDWKVRCLSCYRAYKAHTHSGGYRFRF